MKYKTSFQVTGSFFLVLFFILGWIVKFHLSWLSGFDQWFTDIVRASYPDLNSYQLFMTKFGNPLTVIILFACTALWMWYKKKRAETVWFVSGFIVIAGIINPLIKLFFMRERPSLTHLVVETSYSFPSGHAAGSIILYGSFLFLLPAFVQKRTLRTLLQLLMVFIIVSVGISRIYLGVHFPTDIIGGYLLSFSWLCLTYPVYREKRKQIGNSYRKKDF